MTTQSLDERSGEINILFRFCGLKTPPLVTGGAWPWPGTAMPYAPAAAERVVYQAILKA